MAPAASVGTLIFYVDDVHALYHRLVEGDLRTSTVPEDAPWGELYFQINDTNSHEMSFAKRLAQRGERD